MNTDCPMRVQISMNTAPEKALEYLDFVRDCIKDGSWAKGPEKFGE